MAPKGDNVVVSSMKLEKLLCMKGGKGEASYANNSQAQVADFSFHSCISFSWFKFPDSCIYKCFIVDMYMRTNS